MGTKIYSNLEDMENEKGKSTENECSFQFHDFVINAGDLTIACHTIKMDNCLYLWVGDLHDYSMNDLSFAIESRLTKEPLETKIIGPISKDVSSNIARRLSKKLLKPVYVSFNVEADNLSLPVIERKLQDEFNKHPEVL
ncbi:proteasome assembly chaperone 4 [Calliopsis andreniformis]|uniref:proteasome assembly chaperone 4 n=1 Tax=Calliopsis andreniformis TaxID=337506 RepID=UPI003FCCA781